MKARGARIAAVSRRRPADNAGCTLGVGIDRFYQVASGHKAVWIGFWWITVSSRFFGSDRLQNNTWDVRVDQRWNGIRRRMIRFDTGTASENMRKTTDWKL